VSVDNQVSTTAFVAMVRQLLYNHQTELTQLTTSWKRQMNRAIHFKFGTDIENGPQLLRHDHKMTTRSTWPRSRDSISKFWDPLMTLELIDVYASNLAQT